MFPTNASTLMSYDNTAGAVTVALDRVLKEGILPTGTNFTQILNNLRKFCKMYKICGNLALVLKKLFFRIIWRYEECTESTATGYSFDLIRDQHVDVLFAPPCIDGALLAGHVGTYYNIPVLLWGQTFDSEFANADVYPTVMSAVSNYEDMGSVICTLLTYYHWDSYALIYQFNEDGTCYSFQQDMEAVSQNREDCTIAYKEPVDSWEEDDIQYTLEMIKATSRIIVMCFDDVVQQRMFALKLVDAHLDTEEFVYILPYTDMKMSLGVIDDPFWIDRNKDKDGRDDDAKVIGVRSLVVSISVDATSDLRDVFTNFSDEVMAHMSMWPFYCAECDRGQGASPYAATLYDATYIYGLALSRIINATGINPATYRDGELLSKSSNVEFEGMSGTVTIGDDGVRNSIYFIYCFENDGSLMEYLSLAVNDNGVQNATPLYTDAATTIWASRGGMQPLSTPLCGFDGKSCPIDFFAMYLGYFIAAIFVGMAIIVGSIYGTYYIFR
ncbi:hypothetical protein FO519_009788 [Halicephalobus sp. NKZ332]|nr:hypothetical protein FO519_009788 [Halicephalobus sp. NKZ332]